MGFDCLNVPARQAPGSILSLSHLLSTLPPKRMTSSHSSWEFRHKMIYFYKLFIIVFVQQYTILRLKSMYFPKQKFRFRWRNLLFPRLGKDKDILYAGHNTLTRLGKGTSNNTSGFKYGGGGVREERGWEGSCNVK